MNEQQQLEKELADVREALAAMNRRYNRLAVALHQLTNASDQLCNNLSLMCEAHLAGDTGTVMQQVQRFTSAYSKNLKPAGRVH